MDILRFTLSGKQAFFKKPEVNSYYYFTYGNIHKVALLGIFGAILGYGGYTQMQGFVKDKKQSRLSPGFPEFYEKLQKLRISILPASDSKNGVIPKKIQTFNNSVGYASREQGGNLIVKEQWLEYPKWEICLLVDSDEAKKIKEAVVQKKCVYYPYLGKNDHPADIYDVRTLEAKIAAAERGRLHCLALKEEIASAEPDFDDFDDEDNADGENADGCGSFRYEEALPCGMDEWTNHYLMKTFVFTDALLETDADVFLLEDGKRILFY